MRPIAVLGGVMALSFLMSGCGAGWHRVSGPEPGTIRPRQQVQVWHDGRPEQWHGVVVTAQSISGVPYHKSVECDSCRLAIPRAEVDSLRFGNPTAGFWKTLGLVVGIPAAALVVLCGVSEEGGPPCGE